jgi:putative redox protein
LYIDIGKVTIKYNMKLYPFAVFSNKAGMKQLEVKYSGELRTESTHLKSEKVIITDAPTDNNGKGQAHSPTDLLCSALASCMLTVMGIEANKQQWNIEGAKAEVEKIMQANPRKVAGARISIFMPATCPKDSNSRALLENLAHNCPVALSLSSELRQEVSFVYL